MKRLRERGAGGRRFLNANENHSQRGVSLFWCVTPPAHQRSTVVEQRGRSPRQSAKLKCKSEGAPRRSAKVKCESEVCREAAPIIPQNARRVKYFLHKKREHLLLFTFSHSYYNICSLFRLRLVLCP